MTDDIVERLRTREMMAMILKNKPNLYKDAADEIDVQAKRIAELEAALKDAMEELRHAYIMGFTERYRDAARAALKALGEKE